MLKYETGNLVTDTYPLFCHQVNCKGKMGAGIAKQIRNEYPEIYHEYKHLCDNGEAKLGEVLPVETSDGRICFNMFAQYSYGYDGCYTDYDAFKKCLDSISKFMANHMMKLPVAFPCYIGCGHAGGDWRKILALLENFAKDKDVIIVSLR